MVFLYISFICRCCSIQPPDSAGSFLEELSIQQVVAGDIHVPAFCHTGDTERTRHVIHGINARGIGNAVIDIADNFREFQRKCDLLHINALRQGQILCLCSCKDFFGSRDRRFVNIGGSVCSKIPK